MIREADSNDLFWIMALMQELREESPVFNEMPEEYDYVKNCIQGFIDSPAGIVLVDGAVRGVMFGVVSSQWYSSELVAYEGVLYVSTHARQFGIAQKLIREFEHRAKEKGAKGVLTGATVGIADEKVGKLYKSLGYIEARGGFWRSL